MQLLLVILKKIYKILKWSRRPLFYFPGTRRQNFGIFLALITLATTGYIFTRDRTPLSTFNETKILVEESLKEYYLEEKGVGCEIPKVNPFSAEAMKFVQDFPKITCEGTDWVICKKSECYVADEILKNVTDVICTYRDIVYVDDHLYFLSDGTKVSGREKYMLNRSDHVKVFCTGRDLNSYSILYSRWSGLKAGFRPVESLPVPRSRKDSFNVILLLFDSASHNGFIRKMPKSFKYIADRAVILNGFNIAGDGTPAALYPLLSGKAEFEHPDARGRITNNVYVDHKMFIFHQLKEYGYRTAFFEDSPMTGAFVYKFNGFRRQPADHYLRPFLLENANKILTYMTVFHNVFCVGDTPQYQLLLNLTNEFLQLDGKKFGFTFIGDISHDEFNRISTADEAVVEFLETLAARRVFDDTLVMVMGDHGIRFGTEIRETRQGILEERLPLMSIFLPEKLKQLRPDALDALKQNKDVLTTFFDIHATLLDVLDLKDLSNKYKIPGSDLPRAMSLLEPIPKTRTCAEAGIVKRWCTCFKWFDVPQLDPMYNKVANVLAEYIDNVSEEQRSKCARRQLISTKSVLRHNVNKQLLSSNQINSFIGYFRVAAPRRALKEYYQATITLSPGRGVFEATIMYNTQTDYFTITQRDISRISAYGNESKCVYGTHPHLYSFCYCKDHLLEQDMVSTSQEIESKND